MSRLSEQIKTSATIGDLPSGISNPDAWPPNYADGFNDALRLVFEILGVECQVPFSWVYQASSAHFSE